MLLFQILNNYIHSVLFLCVHHNFVRHFCEKVGCWPKFLVAAAVLSSTKKIRKIHLSSFLNPPTHNICCYRRSTSLRSQPICSPKQAPLDPNCVDLTSLLTVSSLPLMFPAVRPKSSVLSDPLAGKFPSWNN